MTLASTGPRTGDEPAEGAATEKPDPGAIRARSAQGPAVEDWVVEELRALIARLALRLDDVERFLPSLTDVAAAEAAPSGPSAYAGGIDPGVEEYADLTGWVQGYFATVYPRPLGGQWRWCPQWTEHPEAAERLDALWQTWRAAQRHPPLGMATWLRDHLDHHLPILLGAAGPFAGCSPERHEPHRRLPVDADAITTGSR